MNKTIHTIWLDQDQPERVEVALGRWKRLNPGWDIVLHTTGEELHDDYRPYYDMAKKPSIRADLLRLSLLERHGGAYADLDAWPITPLDEWLPPVSADAILAATLPMGVLDSWFLACEAGAAVLEEMRALACWLGDTARELSLIHI